MVCGSRVWGRLLIVGSDMSSKLRKEQQCVVSCSEHNVVDGTSHMISVKVNSRIWG